jgi:hypothetical protein
MAAAAQTAAAVYGNSMQAAGATNPAAAAASATAEQNMYSMQHLQSMAEQAAQQQAHWKITGHSSTQVCIHWPAGKFWYGYACK